MAYTTAILQFEPAPETARMPELRTRLQAVSGVRFAYYYPDRAQVHVKYDPEKVVLPQIRAVLAALGLAVAFK
ncbi:MAG: hypothetical protein ACYC6M_04575 [Terriglobales bacterium]